MTKWQDLFDRDEGRVVAGVGFSVLLYTHGNLRYSEGDRSITLLTNVVDESDRLGGRWLIFPRMVLIVYLPVLLKWDSGAPLDSAVTPIVIGRIMKAIATAGESARVEVSDEAYLQAEKDFEKLGPKGNRQND